MENKKTNWQDVKVFFNGREIKSIKSVSYEQKFTFEQLNEKLKEAEENEDYELCSELKNKIDNYKE
jgi:protein-arginine kinase activator protein McsA